MNLRTGTREARHLRTNEPGSVSSSASVCAVVAGAARVSAAGCGTINARMATREVDATIEASRPLMQSNTEERDLGYGRIR